jgi:hypothetical protein
MANCCFARRRRQAILFVGALLITPAHAEQTMGATTTTGSALAMLAKPGGDSQMVRTYLDGIVAGLLWAEVDLRQKGLPHLFCPPVKMGITTDLEIDILQRYVENNVALKPSDQPVGLIMREALKETFPCEQGGAK